MLGENFSNLLLKLSSSLSHGKVDTTNYLIKSVYINLSNFQKVCKKDPNKFKLLPDTKEKIASLIKMLKYI